MRWFLDTHAGRGLAAVVLAALFLAWPLSLVWAAAAVCVFYATDQFRTSFRLIEAEDATGGPAVPAARTPDAMERDCDMEAIVASLAASPAAPAIREW